jgi:hypothetical protein
MRKLLFLMAFASLTMFAVSPAMATMFGFERITNDADSNLAGQLLVDVTQNGNLVDFKFTNKVGIASSITDIYFDDGTLLGISSIKDSGDGVAFKKPATPGELPSANTATPSFNTTAGFSADSDSPVSQNGVDSAIEWVTITFSLINNKTYTDTLAAIKSGDLRMGLHVQAIGITGKSDSYVNTPNPVPLPGAVLLLGAGMARLVAYARRRQD